MMSSWLTIVRICDICQFKKKSENKDIIIQIAFVYSCNFSNTKLLIFVCVWDGSNSEKNLI